MDTWEGDTSRIEREMNGVHLANPHTLREPDIDLASLRHNSHVGNWLTSAGERISECSHPLSRDCVRSQVSVVSDPTEWTSLPWDADQNLGEISWHDPLATEGK